MVSLERLRAFLHLLKTKKLKRWSVSAFREFRLNGVKGVLRRLRALLSNPYPFLVYSVDEWKKVRQRKVALFSTDQKPRRDWITVIIPFIRRKRDFSLEIINSLLYQSYEKVEVMAVLSGYGFHFPQELERVMRNERFRMFCFPSEQPEERLINKGIKEASGEFFFIAEKDEVYPKNVIHLKMKNGLSLKENIDTLKASLSPKIAYIVPRIGISGGIHVVLEHTGRLFKKGYDVSIITLDPFVATSWFRSEVPIIAATSKQKYLLENIDILVATHWTTAFFMDLLPAKRKIFFVQSDERRFNPDDEDEKRSIEAAYLMNCEYMTEAIWIQRWLEEEFGHYAHYVPNGIDLSVFHKTEPVKPKGKKPRILLEGAIDVWFKGMQDAYDAIKDLDAEIWIVSCEGKPKAGWRYDAFFEGVPIEEMKRIYSSCDILLKMSRVEGFFGPPMEAMACGCAVVVGKVSGFDEYIRHGENALAVEMGDITAAKRAVQSLIDDKDLRLRCIEGGYKTVKEWSWDRSIDMLEKVLAREPDQMSRHDGFPERFTY